jgi:hypothetical protein
MRPTLAAESLKANLTQYLITTFGLTEAVVRNALSAFLTPRGARHLPRAVPAHPYPVSSGSARLAQSPGVGADELDPLRPSGEGVRPALGPARSGQADAGDHRDRLGQD